jgi:flagellar P-ring protein precursor FlgI
VAPPFLSAQAPPEQIPAPAPAAQPPQQTPGQPGSKKGDGVRLKDLARISGIRSNQLIGYGLAVGLPGTGDSRSSLAAESIQNLLGNIGQKLDDAGKNARNIAAVLVTAELPPFAKRGDRISVTVSSIGDARSLEGGVLVRTPLYGGNNIIYGVSQGVITTSGPAGERKSGNRTVGLVLNGGNIEKEIDSTYVENRSVRISLNNFDFATLNQVQAEIKRLQPNAEAKIDGGSVIVTVPENREPVEFIALIEEIRVVPEYRARVVINERTGTIVMGGEIRVDPVAVTRGGMQLIVSGQNRRAESMGIVVPTGQEKGGDATKELKAASVQEIISALNAMGAGVRDIIAILQALKDSGALHAELTVI